MRAPIPTAIVALVLASHSPALAASAKPAAIVSPPLSIEREHLEDLRRGRGSSKRGDATPSDVYIDRYNYDVSINYVGHAESKCWRRPPVLCRRQLHELAASGSVACLRAP